jgi:hypothetical protein
MLTMQTWLITLHGPAGIVSTVDTGESQFVIGTETASDVFTVNGKGVMPRTTRTRTPKLEPLCERLDGF